MTTRSILFPEIEPAVPVSTLTLTQITARGSILFCIIATLIALT